MSRLHDRWDALIAHEDAEWQIGSDLRITLASYALLEIEGAFVYVAVEGNQAKVLHPEAGRVLHSLRLESTESIASVVWHAVNVRTLSQGRSAPVDLKKDGGFDLPLTRGGWSRCTPRT